MTDEAQDQVIGKLVRERRAAQMRLDTLRREGKNQGGPSSEPEHPPQENRGSAPALTHK